MRLNQTSLTISGSSTDNAFSFLFQHHTSLPQLISRLNHLTSDLQDQGDPCLNPSHVPQISLQPFISLVTIIGAEVD